MADVSDRRVGGCLINLYDEKNFLDARGRTDYFAVAFDIDIIFVEKSL